MKTEEDLYRLTGFLTADRLAGVNRSMQSAARPAYKFKSLSLDAENALNSGKWVDNTPISVPVLVIRGVD